MLRRWDKSANCLQKSWFYFRNIYFKTAMCGILMAADCKTVYFPCKLMSRLRWNLDASKQREKKSWIFKQQWKISEKFISLTWIKEKFFVKLNFKKTLFQIRCVTSVLTTKKGHKSSWSLGFSFISLRNQSSHKSSEFWWFIYQLLQPNWPQK